MALEFAALEAMVGAVTVAALANARATLPGQAALVQGIYTRNPYSASLGGAGLAVRNTSFVCATAALQVPVAKGQPLSITYGEGPGAQAYKVYSREDSFETGQTALVLEAA